MYEAGYRAPAVLNPARIFSISARSSSDKLTTVAFSLILEGLLLPGIGMILGMPGRFETFKIQPMAIWPGVHPFFSANASTCLTSSRFFGKFSGENCGQWRRGSFSGMSSRDLICPPRNPLPRGATGPFSQPIMHGEREGLTYSMQLRGYSAQHKSLGHPCEEDRGGRG